MRLLLPLLFLCVFAAAVSAAPSIDQPFAELKLSDGRVLRNARLRSFNSDSIFVKCDDGILQLPYRAFPADLQPQLAQARAKALAADSASAPPPNPPAPPVAPGFRPAPPRPSAYQMSQDEMERLALAKEKANEWARQHFHYNALMLSMNVRINDISLQLSEPRRVSLRAPIYQVNGRILMACSDVGSGRDLDPRETLFSVTLEVDAVGRIAVIDSSEKPGDQSEEHKRELADWAAASKQSREDAKNQRQADAKAAYDASQAQFQAKLKGGGGFELSIGMTQDQVRALWGPPARWRSSNDYLQWTYINKGRDEAGRLCNVVVVFSNGQVVTWNND